MDLVKLKSEIEKRMPAKRYEHVLRVMETSVRLAEMHNLPVEKAINAALFHDIAKAMDEDIIVYQLS